MKKITLKRFIVLALSVSMLMPILNGCSTTDENAENDTGTANSASPSMEATMGPGTEATDNAIQPSATNGTGTSGDITNAKEGTYTATAKGYASDVTATVVISKDGKIDKIDVDASGETESIGQVAAPKLASAIVDKQSTSVDTVSGATYTSNAVITAVNDALAKAGAK